MFDLPLFSRALSFAAGKHRIQRRRSPDERTPYLNHPIDLVEVLVQVGGVEDTAVLCAALLHDTIEDTHTTKPELVREFGDEIAALVWELTDDKALPKAERKQRQIHNAPHKSHKARLVGLADKICNVRDLVQECPHNWSYERRHEYYLWARRVVDGMRGTHPSLEAMFDEVVAQGLREYEPNQEGEA